MVNNEQDDKSSKVIRAPLDLRATPPMGNDTDRRSEAGSKGRRRNSAERACSPSTESSVYSPRLTALGCLAIRRLVVKERESRTLTAVLGENRTIIILRY